MGKRSNLERLPADFYPTPRAAVVPLTPKTGSDGEGRSPIHSMDVVKLHTPSERRQRRKQQRIQRAVMRVPLLKGL